MERKHTRTHSAPARRSERLGRRALADALLLGSEACSFASDALAAVSTTSPSIAEMSMTSTASKDVSCDLGADIEERKCLRIKRLSCTYGCTPILVTQTFAEVDAGLGGGSTSSSTRPGDGSAMQAHLARIGKQITG
jgi:hypothetical protein